MILLTGIVIGSLAFTTEILVDRHLPTSRRVSVAACFALTGFVFGFGALACYLFHDGILPDDERLSGWEAVVSFCRAFVAGPMLIGMPLLAAGLILRRFPRPARRAEADVCCRQLAGRSD